MRISDTDLTERLRTSLSQNLQRLTDISRQVGSGKKLNTPSDDPSATAYALRYRGDVQLNRQFNRTVEVSRSRLSAADQALGSLTDTLQRGRELVLRAGSPTVGSAELQQIAAEINQLVLHTVQLGNTSFAGQFIFAGTKTNTAPFNAASDTPVAITYAGNSTAISQSVGRDAQIRVDVPGNEAFLPSMNALIAVRDALNAGDTSGAGQAGLAGLDSALDSLMSVRGGIGVRVNRLDTLTDRIEEEHTSLQELIGNVEDIDFADAIVRLDAAKNAYQATLGAAAKSVRQTLVDYLR